MTSTYPLFLNMEGRRCLVIGGGSVAARKTRSLIESGAHVRVVAPDLGPDMADLVKSGQVGWEARAAVETDVEAADLVFLASSDPDVHARLAERARERGALVNQADAPGGGDFQVPAIVRRGDVTVAISTGGRSPAFARMLRQEIESAIDDDQLSLLDVLAEARDLARQHGWSANGERWERAVDGETRDLVHRGERELAVKRVAERLRQQTDGVETQ